MDDQETANRDEFWFNNGLVSWLDAYIEKINDDHTKSQLGLIRTFMVNANGELNGHRNSPRHWGNKDGSHDN